MSQALQAEPQPIRLDGPAGPVLGRYFAAAEPRAAVLSLPALGMPAGYYDPFAGCLAKHGMATLSYEQRGHGDHPVRPSRRVDYSTREWLVDDMPVVLDWLRKQAPGVPLILAGHSLGAHVGAAYLGWRPEAIDGFVAIAAAPPYPGHFDAKTAWQIRLLSRVIIPGSRLLLGTYPGDRIGFGGREARGLMRDWNRWARTNRYRVPGEEVDVEAALARLTLPVLQVRFADDPFAPARGADAVTDKFPRASVTKRVVTAADLGDRANHFRWARQGSAVAGLVDRWWAG